MTVVYKEAHASKFRVCHVASPDTCGAPEVVSPCIVCSGLTCSLLSAPVRRNHELVRIECLTLQGHDSSPSLLLICTDMVGLICQSTVMGQRFSMLTLSRALSIPAYGCRYCCTCDKYLTGCRLANVTRELSGKQHGSCTSATAGFHRHSSSTKGMSLECY